MAESVNRDSTTLEGLEKFIEHTYNRTINMSGREAPTLMELLMSPVPKDSTRAVSTPIKRSDVQITNDNISVIQRTQDNKRKASASIHLSDSGDSTMDTSMKDYLDQMTESIMEKISSSSQHLESLITSQGSDIEKLRTENHVLNMRCQINEGRLTRVEKVVSNLKEELLRVQQRGMKENIVFQNLPEVDHENVRTTLMEYMTKSLKISPEQIRNIEIERAHRMGQKSQYPRLIVAKINDEGRNVIFRHTKNLKGGTTSVYTQLPRELTERRKQLVPTEAY